MWYDYNYFRLSVSSPIGTNVSPWTLSRAKILCRWYTVIYSDSDWLTETITVTETISVTVREIDIDSVTYILTDKYSDRFSDRDRDIDWDSEGDSAVSETGKETDTFWFQRQWHRQ